MKGQLYERTVSSVWAAFFEKFNAAEVSAACVAKAQYRGLVNAASSVYNWSAYETLLHKLPQDKLDNRLAELVKTCDGEEELRRAYEGLSMSKPKGESCHYLMVHAGAGAQEIQDTWSCNGRVEAFKGTFLHKQIELVLQKLGELQWLSGRRRVPVSLLLGESEVLAALKDAAAPWKVMSSLDWSNISKLICGIIPRCKAFFVPPIAAPTDSTISCRGCRRRGHGRRTAQNTVYTTKTNR